MGAIAMTEPTTGSDLQAIKTYAVKDGMTTSLMSKPSSLMANMPT